MTFFLSFKYFFVFSTTTLLHYLCTKPYITRDYFISSAHHELAAPVSMGAAHQAALKTSGQTELCIHPGSTACIAHVSEVCRKQLVDAGGVRLRPAAAGHKAPAEGETDV